MAKVSLCVLTSATDIANFQMQGLAFDSLETVFKATDVKMMLDLEPLAVPTNSTVFVVVDPAAGGPSSDYAIVSIARVRGTVNVSLFYVYSCKYVQLLAEEDKVRGGHVVVFEVGRDGVLVEVEEEARELALVDLAPRDALLEGGVDVEEEEEGGEEGEVRRGLERADELVGLVPRIAGVAVERGVVEYLFDGLDAFYDDEAQRLDVDGEEEALDVLGDELVCGLCVG